LKRLWGRFSNQEEQMEAKELIEEIKLNVIQGRVEREDDGYDEGLEGRPAVVELVQEAVVQGVDAKAIIVDGLTAGMKVVGRHFEDGKYLIPDMLAAAEAVGGAMDVLAPHLEKAGIESKGTVVLATVAGDLHDIGKNIVGIMFKGAGYSVVDLGSDVPVEKIVAAVKEHKAGFLGMSALLTTTMWHMEEVIRELEKEGLRTEVTVLVGGAPTSEGFTKKVNADCYCPDAFHGIRFVDSIVGG